MRCQRERNAFCVVVFNRTIQSEPISFSVSNSEDHWSILNGGEGQPLDILSSTWNKCKEVERRKWVRSRNGSGRGSWSSRLSMINICIERSHALLSLRNSEPQGSGPILETKYCCQVSQKYLRHKLRSLQGTYVDFACSLDLGFGVVIPTIRRICYRKEMYVASSESRMNARGEQEEVP